MKLVICALLVIATAAASDPQPLIHTAAARQHETGFGDAIADSIRAATHADIASYVLRNGSAD